MVGGLGEGSEALDDGVWGGVFAEKKGLFRIILLPLGVRLRAPCHLNVHLHHTRSGRKKGVGGFK